MPTKYIARKFNPGKADHTKINTLINLSSLSLNSSQSILKTSLALGSAQTNNYTGDSLYPFNDGLNQDQNSFSQYVDITKNNLMHIMIYHINRDVNS